MTAIRSGSGPGYRTERSVRVSGARVARDEDLDATVLGYRVHDL